VFRLGKRPLLASQAMFPKALTRISREKCQRVVKVYLILKKSPNYLNYAPAFVCLARWFSAHWQTILIEGSITTWHYEL
jgi:hypothetical protein